MAKNGRRTKRTPALVQALCDVLRLGGTRTAACQRVQLDRQTFYLWMERFPAFSGAIEQAEADAELRYLAPIARAANEGDWRAGVAWLERRRPLDWAPRPAVEAQVTLDVGALMRAHLVRPAPLPLPEAEPESNVIDIEADGHTTNGATTTDT